MKLIKHTYILLFLLNSFVLFAQEMPPPPAGVSTQIIPQKVEVAQTKSNYESVVVVQQNRSPRKRTQDTTMTNIAPTEIWEENPFALIEAGNPFALDVPERVNEKTTNEIASENNTPKSIPENLAPSNRIEDLRTSIVKQGGFVYFMTAILGFLAMILSVYRQDVKRIFYSFGNLNLVGQLYREQPDSLTLSNILLQVLFSLTGGTLVYLASESMGAVVHKQPFIGLSMCIGGVGSIFLLKHILNSLLSIIFPFGGELSFYDFMLSNNNKALGIALLPLLFASAYTPEHIAYTSLNMALGLSLLSYSYCFIKGLVASGNYIFLNKFHFFIYLCTVEIAPIIIGIKLIANAM